MPTREDEYHPEQVTLFVWDNEVSIYDPALGQALTFLSPKWRDVLLLYYFLDKSDIQIAKLLAITPRAVCQRRKAALTRLRGILEAMEHED